MLTPRSIYPGDSPVHLWYYSSIPVQNIPNSTLFHGKKWKIPPYSSIKNKYNGISYSSQINDYNCINNVGASQEHNIILSKKKNHEKYIQYDSIYRKFKKTENGTTNH